MKFLLLCCFVLCSTLSFGQTTQKWNAGLSFGSGLLLGELSTHKLPLHAGFFAERKLGKMLTVGLQFMHFNYANRIDDVDVVAYDRKSWPYITSETLKADFRMKSTGQIWAINLALDITPNWANQEKFSMALLTGIGMGGFCSSATFIDKRDSMGGIGGNPNYGKTVTETYDGRHWFVPVGMGFTYNLNQKINLGLQAQWCYLRSDDVDLVYNGKFDHLLNAYLKVGYRF